MLYPKSGVVLKYTRSPNRKETDNMKITQDEIEKYLTGTAYVTAENGKARPHRFTPEQERAYDGTDYSRKLCCGSGVCLSVRTDALAVAIDFTASEGSSRTYFSMDVTADGVGVGSITNHSGDMPHEHYPGIRRLLGDYRGLFPLPEGEKTVRIYFPWSVTVDVAEADFKGATFIAPAPREKTFLFFGDSITHGYDATFTTKKYSTLVAEAFGADEHNKAIGGDFFKPEIAAIKESYTPTAIFVAYGTNDWRACTREYTQKRADEFYAALHDNYPGVPVFAMCPIWRRDLEKPEWSKCEFGDFRGVAEVITAAAKYENMHVIDCYDFVPHDEKYFADAWVHPSDEGYRLYADALINAVKATGEKL